LTFCNALPVRARVGSGTITAIYYYYYYYYTDRVLHGGDAGSVLVFELRVAPTIMTLTRWILS